MAMHAYEMNIGLLTESNQIWEIRLLRKVMALMGAPLHSSL